MDGAIAELLQLLSEGMAEHLRQSAASAAEKESGAVCFAARSRLFTQSAAIYRALGPEAFAEEQDDDAENAPPP